ncbi:MAG: hypothetical protein ACLSHW_07750 [Lachnospiraceae bacterium]
MEKEMKKGIIAIMVILCLGLMGFVGFMKFSEDNTPPEIQFQDNEIVYTAGDSYDGLLDGVTATDNKDGDVTESLVVESVYPQRRRTDCYDCICCKRLPKQCGKSK